MADPPPTLSFPGVTIPGFTIPVVSVTVPAVTLTFPAITFPGGPGQGPPPPSSTPPQPPSQPTASAPIGGLSSTPTPMPSTTAPVALSTTPQGTTPQPTFAPQSAATTDKSFLHNKAAAGAVFTILAIFLLALAVTAFCCYKRRQSQRRRDARPKNPIVDADDDAPFAPQFQLLSGAGAAAAGYGPGEHDGGGYTDEEKALPAYGGYGVALPLAPEKEKKALPNEPDEAAYDGYTVAPAPGHPYSMRSLSRTSTPGMAGVGAGAQLQSPRSRYSQRFAAPAAAVVEGPPERPHLPRGDTERLSDWEEARRMSDLKVTNV